MARTPALAWPTFLVGSGYLLLVAWCWFLILTGRENPWLVIPAIGIGGFYALTVVHEAAHGLVSRNRNFNEVFGSLVSATVLPGLTSVYYTWEHNSHHRYLGQVQDLDTYLFVHPVWARPFTWLVTDYHLAAGYIPVFNSRPRREKMYFYAAVGTALAIVIAAAFTGHLLDVFLYWFIPSRIALLIYQLLFGYMPHAPGLLSEQEHGPFAVSKVFTGYERVLTPLLMFQNYHLIHHLIPTVPFYRYGRVWRHKRDFLIAQGAAVVALRREHSRPPLPSAEPRG